MCVCVCVLVSRLANKVLIGKYLPAMIVVSEAGGAMDPNQQLLTSLLHDSNRGPLDHASRGP